MPTNEELLEAITQWDEENQNNMAARYLRSEFKVLSKRLTQLTDGRGGEKPSPGLAAAKGAAREGHAAAEYESRPAVPEGRPISEQPTSFDEAAKAAHGKFMEQVTGANS